MLQSNRNFKLSYPIFILPVILSVLNLIDVHHLQNVTFSYEMGSNGQNQSSPDSRLS